MARVCPVRAKWNRPESAFRHGIRRHQTRKRAERLRWGEFGPLADYHFRRPQRQRHLASLYFEQFSYRIRFEFSKWALQGRPILRFKTGSINLTASYAKICNSVRDDALINFVHIDANLLYILNYLT